MFSQKSGRKLKVATIKLATESSKKQSRIQCEQQLPCYNILDRFCS
jgi:hypothetical protein